MAEPTALIRILRRIPILALVLIGNWAAITSLQAQGPVSQDSTRARVKVSRYELSIAFPQEPKLNWTWPSAEIGNKDREFFWMAVIEGIDGTMHFYLAYDGRGSGKPVAASLDSVVRAATQRLCREIMMSAQCTSNGIHVGVERGHVTITYRDSLRIERMFGLRPRTVQILAGVPAYVGGPVSEQVPVQYVEPQLAVFDSARRAEAVKTRRDYERGMNSYGRTISGGSSADLLWLAVGDSARLGIDEWSCHSDMCTGHLSVEDGRQEWGRWSAADPSVAEVHRTRTRSGERLGFNGDRGMTIVGLRPGRTTVRASGVHSAIDTLVSMIPIDSILERKVLVTVPIGTFRITPRPTTMIVGQTTLFSVQVLDRAGRLIEGTPVKLEWGTAMSKLGGPPGPASVRFPQTGRFEIVAFLGAHADTVHVEVIAPPR